MPSCPIVRPESVRLYLVDVHKRALDQLMARKRPATPEEIDAAKACIATATENADWLDVKKELNSGEYRAMVAAHYKEGGGELSVDLSRMGGITRVLAYVLGWSFIGLDGQPLPFTEAAVKSFDMGVYSDVVEAVDTHQAESEQRIEARKNGQGGGTSSSATLPSASTTAGAMSGSTPSIEMSTS